MRFMTTSKFYAWFSLVLALSVMVLTVLAQETPQKTAPAVQQPVIQQSAIQQSAPAEETAAPQFPPTNDPKEIVRRSVEVDHRAMEMARNYTCQQREVVKHLGKKGEVKSTEIKTYD